MKPISPIEKNPKCLIAPQGEFMLERNPRDEFLQAWDAADEYLLQQVEDAKLLSQHASILIVNDAFGALSTGLAEFRPLSMNDSYLAQQAMIDNLRLNGIDPGLVSFDDGLRPLTRPFDLVFIKIPRSLAMLEHQLFMIRGSLRASTRIIGAGMSRAIHSSTLELFEDLLGPTTSSLARKKARLIFIERDESMNEGQSPYPIQYVVEADREYTISSHANVFSRDRLDGGSRLLIENLSADERYRRIVDLGCGNGLLGIIAASLNPLASLLFVDESHMAIASARENFVSAFGRRRDAEFKVGNSLQGVADQSNDLILNNPPFHQNNSTGDGIAWQMFIDARRVLRPRGELWVVGNRHLGYHAKLKKLFGNSELITSNRKYVVLRSIKSEAL